MYHRHKKNQLFNIFPRVETSWTLLITPNTTVMEGRRVALLCRTPNNDPDANILWIKRFSVLMLVKIDR